MNTMICQKTEKDEKLLEAEGKWSGHRLFPFCQNPVFGIWRCEKSYERSGAPDQLLRNRSDSYRPPPVNDKFAKIKKSS